MKFMILSDNHGRWKTVDELLQHYRPQVDYIFHCGDSEFWPNDTVWEMVDAVVTGNNDYHPEYPAEAVVDTPVGKVYLTHGHYHGVYLTTDKVLESAKANGCRFAFHGHTHVAYAKVEDGVVLCNPGSLNYSRGRLSYRTFALMTIEGSQVTVEFFDDQRRPIEPLNQVFNLEGSD